MAGRASLGTVKVGPIEMRGMIKSFEKGHIKRTHESNANGTVDYHEERVPMKLVVEIGVLKDTDLEAIEKLVGEVGLLTYHTNSLKYRLPKVDFAERGEIGPEGKCDVTFGGEPAVKA